MIKQLKPETEKLEYPNGDKYIGELADKKRNGFGVYVSHLGINT